MDPAIADQLLRILSENFPAIGSKQLAEKSGVEENDVIKTLYEVKYTQPGLFTISTGLGENIKDYQPMPSSISEILSAGGIAQLYKNFNSKLSSNEVVEATRRRIEGEIKYTLYRNNIIAFFVISAVIALFFFVVYKLKTNL